MLTIELILICIAFLGIVYMIGNLFPLKFYLKGIPLLSQRMVVGLSTIIFLVRLPIRYSFSPNVFEYILYTMIIIGLIKVIYTFTKNRKIKIHKKRLKISQIVLVFFTITIFISPLYPIIKGDGLYYLRAGPDMTGHLIQAASLNDGYNFEKTEKLFRNDQGNKDWWDLKTNPWQASDFKEAIAIEFTLRTQRFTHAIFTNLIKNLFGIQIWVSFIAGYIVFIAILMILIIDYLRKYKIDNLTIGATLAIIFCSHSFILMVHEGIIAQIYSLPVFLFITVYIDKIFNKKLTLGNIFLLVIVLSGFLNTMSEAVLIYFLFFTILMVVSLMEKENFIITILNIAKIGLGVLITSWVYIFDLLKMYEMRREQGFSYTGFGDVPWNTLAVLFSVPYFEVQDLNVLALKVKENNLSFALISILIVSLLYKKYKTKIVNSDLNIVLSLLILLIVFILMNKNYPLWKVSVIIQSSLFLIMVKNLIANNKPAKYFRVGLISYSIIVLLFGYRLLEQYSKISIKVTENSFRAPFNNVNDKVDRFALLTPSANTLYSVQGLNSNLYYVNSGWGPIFKEEEINLPIYKYFNCQVEGPVTCLELIDNGVLPAQLYKTIYSIGDLTSNRGIVDKDKLQILINREFFN